MKFFVDNIFLIGLVVISGGALLIPYLQQRGSKLTLLQATQLINTGKSLVLDVRDTEQFASAHLREARNIPLKELSHRVGELDKFKGKNVIVVCQSGTQTARAEGILKKAGFTEVHGLTGGIAAWQARSADRNSEGGQMSARVVMYSTGVCPYCMMAERLLKSKGIEGIEKIRVDLDPQQRDIMMQRTGRRTVPQIYIGETHVGGFDDLSALDRAGGLDPLLQA